MPQTSITHPVSFHVSEVKWLTAFAQELKARYDGLIADVVLHDHAAPGLPVDSLKIQVLILEGDDETKTEIKRLGYALDLDGGYYVVPIINVDTTAEWETRKLRGGALYKSVENTGVSVLT